MTNFTTLSATFIGDFMEVFIRRQKPLPGNTAKETARLEAQFTGFHAGLLHALAFRGNELRRERVRALNFPLESRQSWVPALYDSDFIKWTREVRERWDAGEWKEVSDLNFNNQMELEFLTIVFSQQFMDYYLAVRKSAVKAGTVEPTEDDREWIEAEYEAYHSLAEPLAQLRLRLNAASSDE